MYKYEFVDVETGNNLRETKDTGFEKCKSIINQYAEQGWRLVQVVTPYNEKMGIMRPFKYTIIFEKSM
ncbi:MAG: DUF4177 domain-containing protein [Clostridiales bacterium]|nr:DUF4177 domain-containing protein [Clostridiales bacterium]